jgi:hypothetical protein
LSPRSTLYDYFDLWSYDGTLERIQKKVYGWCRERAEREASPAAANIDSPSVQVGEKRGLCVDPHGYGAGKKIKGKNGIFSSLRRAS